MTPAYARFWLRASFDKRPIDELKKDACFEIIDWQELPIGAAYGQWYLSPRDWSIPQSAIIEVARLFTDPHVAKQVGARKLAHLELLTEQGTQVVLSDMAEEVEEECPTETKSESKLPMLSRLWKRLTGKA